MEILEPASLGVPGPGIAPGVEAAVAVPLPSAAGFEVPDAVLAVPGILLAVGTAAVVFKYWRQGRQYRPYYPEQTKVAPSEQAERTFSAAGSKLILRQICGDISIERGGDEIAATVRGDAGEVERVQFEKSGDVVTLETPDRGILIDMRHLEGIYREVAEKTRQKLAEVEGVTLVERDKLLTIQLTVPEGIDLQVEDFGGNLGAQVPLGEVTLAEVRYADIHMLSTGNLVISQMPLSSKFTFGQINGKADVAVGYYGSLNINGGQIKTLQARVPVASRMECRTAVRNATVEADYGSHTDLAHVDGRLKAKLGVSADLTVGGGQLETADIAMGGWGNLQLDAAADAVKLAAGSKAQAALAHAPATLKLDAGLDSRVAIQGGDIQRAIINATSGADIEISGSVAAGKITAKSSAVVAARSYGQGVARTENGGNIRTHDQIIE